MAQRVLVVEDERDVAELVADVLALEGFEARITSGEAALAEALAFRPNVVLLDLMMPNVDGFEVARQLRENERTRHLPIVVMTAMHNGVGRARRLGAAGLLAKPFDIEELLQAIGQAMTS